MRRLRESGIVTILLLGLTGCAGVQQRLGWTEPPYLGEENSEERPLSRLAFWRRHRAEESTPAESVSDPANPGRSTMIASNDSGDDEERPGLLRRIPLVNRIFKGHEHEESQELEMPAARYAQSLLSAPAIAQARPVAPAGSGTIATSRTIPSDESAGAPVADTQPSPSNTASSTTTASTESDRPDVPPLRELTVDLAGSKPEVDTAAIPARNAPPQAANPPAPPPLQSGTGFGAQQPALAEPSSLPTLGREDVPPPTAAPGAQPNLGSPDLAPVTSNKGPSLPSPSVSSQPANGSNAAPASGSSTLGTVVSTPGPVWPMTTVETTPIYSGSSQSVIVPSGQGEYVSGGCESPCGAKCKVHKLCPLKKHKQMIASSVVLPSGQGTVSSCDAPAPCKKECFLKKWLHHKSGCKSRGCKGCKTCAYCGEAPTMVSSQAPIVSPQW